MNYYNTTNETANEQHANEQQATKQDERIKHFIKRYAVKNFTAYELQDLLNRYRVADYIITSIRRSIHTLTGQGFLADSGETRKERYGRINKVWRVQA